ncbi:MAG TPA: penicillin acylase family protein, partial [Solirubrobacteraceae bacterium]
ELEAFRHATQGRLAELTGKGALADDLAARRDYYTHGELMEMYEALPPTFQRRVEAYRDGINAWIKRMPLDQVPAEFVATATLPTPWRVLDTLSVGVFLARTVPSGDGNELRNLRALQDGGSQVLDKLLPLSIKGQISTVPRANGLFPQGKRLTAKQARAARKRSLAFAATLPKAPATTRTTRAIGGSYMYAVRAPGKRAFLFNGPQLGFAAPELFVELEVHAPGLDVRGVTAPGVPVIGIGHNKDVAWGFTSGLSDEDDLYAEKLVGRERYSYKGAAREMSCRMETFHWKAPVTSLLSGEIPDIGTKKERVCRTVHGPVQEVDGDVAYSRRYAIWGRELDSLIGIDMLNRAKDIRDVDAAARQVTWNENIMAADSQGNIGYWHPGLVQVRPSRWDQRLPLPGTGEAEWAGFVPRSRMPHVINPKQGWLANWNNIPSQGWTTGDAVATERVTGPFHRAGWLNRVVRGLHGLKAPTFADANNAVRRAGSIAQQRPLASARLRRAARGATGAAATVLNTILAWDGDYVATNAAGTVDPGVATFEEFKTAAAKIAVAPFAAGAKHFEDRPGRSHEFDITDKESYALRTLAVAGYRAAAEDAAAALTKRFGTGDAARWREPRRMDDLTAQGAQQAPPLPFFDRGTWEQVIELGP